MTLETPDCLVRFRAEYSFGGKTGVRLGAGLLARVAHCGARTMHVYITGRPARWLRVEHYSESVRGMCRHASQSGSWCFLGLRRKVAHDKGRCRALCWVRTVVLKNHQ